MSFMTQNFWKKFPLLSSEKFHWLTYILQLFAELMALNQIFWCILYLYLVEIWANTHTWLFPTTMDYCIITQDVKIAAVRLYECELLDLEDILDCCGFSHWTWFQIVEQCEGKEQAVGILKIWLSYLFGICQKIWLSAINSANSCNGPLISIVY